MADVSKIERIVRDTLAAELANVKILKVWVREGDSGDDDVVRIDVVFDGTSKDINGRALSGLVRRLRPALVGAGEDVFPLLSFISKADAGPLEFAPA